MLVIGIVIIIAQAVRAILADVIDRDPSPYSTISKVSSRLRIVLAIAAFTNAMFLFKNQGINAVNIIVSLLGLFL